MDINKKYMYHDGFEFVYAGTYKKFKTYKCIWARICKGRLTINLESNQTIIYSHVKKCQYQQKFGKPLKKDIKDNIDDQPNINFDQSITEYKNNEVDKEYIIDDYDSFEEEFIEYYKDYELENVMTKYKEKVEKYSQAKQKIGLKISKELTSEQMKMQIDSIHSAFISRKYIFCDDLIYHQNIKEKDCCEKGRDIELSDGNKFVFYTCKQKMAKGIYPPIIIIDSKDGFAIKAIDSIEKYTFLCEYSGKVEIYEMHENEGDSIMILQNEDSNTMGLDIVPNKITNIARFISGINNTWDQTIKKKCKNVMSFKCEIEGFPHILLYAQRDIKKNEILYYDYNEGDKNEQLYNTDYFIEIDEIVR